jgi:hypothetical protein
MHYFGQRLPKYYINNSTEMWLQQHAANLWPSQGRALLHGHMSLPTDPSACRSPALKTLFIIEEFGIVLCGLEGFGS